MFHNIGFLEKLNSLKFGSGNFAVGELAFKTEDFLIMIVMTFLGMAYRPNPTKPILI